MPFRTKLAAKDTTQVKTKPANETVASSVTLQDDDHLTGFELLPNKAYEFEVILEVNDGVGSGGFRFILNFSQTPSEVPSGLIFALDPGAATESFVGSYGDFTINNLVFSITGTNNRAIKAFGRFTSNATSGGTVGLQWAQNVSDAAATTLREGSLMKVTPIT